MQNIITSILVAVGLSMDAFSLSILYGMLGLHRKKIIILSSVVGVFHFFMPIFGNILGSFIVKVLPVDLNLLVGIIFLLIGFEMLISLFKNEEVKSITSIGNLILFGFTVSIDSFSVGIGLRVISNNYLLTVSIFSLVSFTFTFIGLIIGKKLNDIFGKIATIIGIIILLFLSLFYLF